MSATATKTVRERLEDQIAGFRQDAEIAKGKQDFEAMFELNDMADQLQEQLDTLE